MNNSKQRLEIEKTHFIRFEKIKVTIQLNFCKEVTKIF